MDKTQGAQIQSGHEGIEETHGVLKADVILNPLGQQQHLMASSAGDVAHA